MADHVPSHGFATLDMPILRLSEGRFASCAFLTDDALYDAVGVRIAFTQRTGGASAAPFDTLNLGSHVGDDPSCVQENRRRVLAALGAQHAALIAPNQVHGSVLVGCAAPEEAPACAERAQEGADGVVVTCRDVAALLCFADCVPVVAVSPAGSFAVVHAGWRGVVAHIAEAAVRALCEADGVPASSLNVYLGPHIRGCHFEVGPEVAARFVDEFGPCALRPDGYADMAAALAAGLRGCGVDAARIADAGVCTVCDAGSRYYSYRASGGRCGRHAAVAVRVS